MQGNQDAYLLASLLSPRDLSSLKQHMTATGTVISDSPTSSTILQSGACRACENFATAALPSA